MKTPISILLGIVIIILTIRSFLKHKHKSDCALSALTIKYIYNHLSNEEKEKIDNEANHMIYEQYLKNTSLISDINNYHDVMKFSEKMLKGKKEQNERGYRLFLSNVFVELQLPNPFGHRRYLSKFPFKELVGEEKYALKGMQEYLKDKYQIIVK